MVHARCASSIAKLSVVLWLSCVPGASPWACHTACLWESIFLLEEITENCFKKKNKSWPLRGLVYALTGTWRGCRGGCRSDQASYECGLRHTEMLNCGCAVDALSTVRTQIPVSGISIYLAPCHHHAGII